jgi:hypothetical protein
MSFAIRAAYERVGHGISPQKAFAIVKVIADPSSAASEAAHHKLLKAASARVEAARHMQAPVQRWVQGPAADPGQLLWVGRAAERPPRASELAAFPKHIQP